MPFVINKSVLLRVCSMNIWCNGQSFFFSQFFVERRSVICFNYWRWCTKTVLFCANLMRLCVSCVVCSVDQHRDISWLWTWNWKGYFSWLQRIQNTQLPSAEEWVPTCVCLYTWCWCTLVTLETEMFCDCELENWNGNLCFRINTCLVGLWSTRRVEKAWRNGFWKCAWIHSRRSEKRLLDALLLNWNKNVNDYFFLLENFVWSVYTSL